MVNRIFLVDPEDLSVKMCQTKPLHKEDKVFLISENIDYPEFTGKVSDFLDGKTMFFQIKEAGDINSLIEVECVNGEDIYFIGGRMERYYKECKEEIIKKGHKIGKNRSFGVAKTPLRGKEMQQTLSDFMGDVACALNTSPKPSGQNITTKKEVSYQDTDTAGQESAQSGTEPEPINQVTTIKKTDTAGQVLVPDKSKKEMALQREKQKRSGRQDRKQPDSKTQQNDYSIHALEAEIFGSEVVSKEEIAFDTRVSDAKATITLVLFERLSKHICELTRKSFDQGRCYQFVLLLRKTDNPEQFEESWKTVFPDPSFHILSDTYWILRNEATYYHKICTVLYEEDIWIS